MNLLVATEQVSRDLEEHYRLLQELGGWPEDEPSPAPAPEPEQAQLLGAQELEDEIKFLARQVTYVTWRLAGLRPHVDEAGAQELELAIDRLWSISAQLYLLDLGRYVPLQEDDEE